MAIPESGRTETTSGFGTVGQLVGAQMQRTSTSSGQLDKEKVEPFEIFTRHSILLILNSDGVFATHSHAGVVTSIRRRFDGVVWFHPEASKGGVREVAVKAMVRKSPSKRCLQAVDSVRPPAPIRRVRKSTVIGTRG